MNRFGLPDLGLGIGLRGVHYDHVLEHEPAVDWFEILTENYLGVGGRPMHVLDSVCERYPVALHGVSLSIGSTDALDFDYLRALKRLAARTRCAWLGDHLCWTGVLGQENHDLLPMPYTEQSLVHVAERIRIVQDFLERPLVLENPSTYLAFRESTLDEAEYLARLCERADCALLLDVNNVYVSARNQGFDARAYLARLPLERVVQVHLAGHTDKGTHCLDTHSRPVRDEVWTLYAELVERLGPCATLLEWDADIPAFEVVHAEVEKAREFRPASAASAGGTGSASRSGDA